MLFSRITCLLSVGGINVERGAIHFSRWWRGDEDFFQVSGEGRRIFKGRNESPGGKFF